MFCIKNIIKCTQPRDITQFKIIFTFALNSNVITPKFYEPPKLWGLHKDNFGDFQSKWLRTPRASLQASHENRKSPLFKRNVSNQALNVADNNIPMLVDIMYKYLLLCPAWIHAVLGNIATRRIKVDYQTFWECAVASSRPFVRFCVHRIFSNSLRMDNDTSSIDAES